uniref:Uncharacterized protein n=1 Tax=Dicentrarchus labrax TaxID=13489 RepID=A0A8C4IP92_DICLA
FVLPYTITMIKLNGVKFTLAFTFIKQKITEVNGKNNMLELMLEDANRLMKFYLTKEKSLIEGEFLSFHLKTGAFVLLFSTAFVSQDLRSLLENKQTKHVKAECVFGWCLLLVYFPTVEAKDTEYNSALKCVLFIVPLSSCVCGLTVYPQKLQFFQEEKNKEIVALRQRIKELEENQRPCGFNDGRLKRRKI